MRTCGLLLTILIAWLGGGCQTGPESAARPRPVVFAHPNELRKGEGFVLLADRRLFATMALLNATGFDKEAQGVPMHPIRQQVRRQVAANLAGSPERLQQWRDYVKSRKLDSAIYQDFALTLQADYPFQRIRPDRELRFPALAKVLQEFPEVLRDFWITAHLTNVWNEVKGDYLAELKKYDFVAMQRQMDSLWEYLRIPRRDTMTLVNVPNLLDMHYRALNAHYENYYYCVESPGACSYRLNAHDYLHFIVDPLVKAHFRQAREKLLRYYQAGKDGPVSKSYQDPTGFTLECLVRALDHRLRARWAQEPADVERIEKQLAEQTGKGLTLMRPFYELLSEYEGASVSFDAFLPVLFAHLPDSPRS